VAEVDLSKVKRSKAEGGLNIKQLDEEMMKAVEGIVQKTVELGEGRQAICFFPGVRTAAYAAERFNAVVPGSARFISGETNRDERRCIVDEYRRGGFRYLCNCAVATEGFDAPSTGMIVLARPTTSRALCAQMVGRGTRVLPGLVDGFPGKEDADIRCELIARSGKPNLLVLDFVAMLGSGGHSLVGPEDALGGNYTNEEVQRAKKIAEKEKGGNDVLKNLNRARSELKAMAEALKKKVQVKATVTEMDPFGVFHIDRTKIQKSDMRFGWDPASDAQLAVLRNAGVKEDELEQMGKREASRLISTIIMRRRKGLANLKQLRILKQFGVEKLNVSRESASRGIEVIKRAGWGRRSGVPVQMIENAMGVQ
jgi:superfamily II DNA/RNA helicase